MKIILCYKNFKLGELSFDGKYYCYLALKDNAEFVKQYGFLNFSLANVKKLKEKQMPYFFAEFVERLIHNPHMSTLLNINLNVDNYFDILCRYARLKQDTNAFYYVLAE